MRENAKVLPMDEEAQKAVLTRLIACLNKRERTDLIGQAFRMLAGRCSFDPYASSQEQPEEEQLGTENEDLRDRIFCAHPWDWSEKEIVELDNLGESDAWLREVIQERIFDVLFGSAWNDSFYAEDMACSYLHEIREQGYELPSDFCDASDEDCGIEEDFLQIHKEFRYFLQAWRENILKRIEKAASIKSEVTPGE